MNGNEWSDITLSMITSIAVAHVAGMVTITSGKLGHYTHATIYGARRAYVYN